MTSHPYDITRELMEAIRDLRTVCEFVHFPIQSGSDRILRKMHRLYTVEAYKEKVHMLRDMVPDVALGTDIICGFPGETDEEFEMTVQALQDIRYSVAFLFSYSPRNGTPAMRWRDDIAPEVKDTRLQRLLEVHDKISTQHFQDMLGQTTEILVEKVSHRDPGMLKGRTRCWKNVLFPGPKSLIGSKQRVKLHGFSHQTLIGKAA